MRSARITLRGLNASLIRKSLLPEASEEIPRARVSLEGDDKTLEIVIEADDTGALRAAMNAYLRWATISQSIGEEVG
jgi:tRNA threonylcarbamoyladenosine modification (KEOPS) complex  Pcc1 subunit